MLEQVPLGWLGANRHLYCSQACAFRANQHDATPVDEDDFDALARELGLDIDATCPACGSRYLVAWAGPADG